MPDTASQLWLAALPGLQLGCEHKCTLSWVLGDPCTLGMRDYLGGYGFLPWCSQLADPPLPPLAGGSTGPTSARAREFSSPRSSDSLHAPVPHTLSLIVVCRRILSCSSKRS